MGDGRVVPRLRFFSGLDHVTLLAPSLLFVALALVLNATPVVRAESAETRCKALKGFTRAFWGIGLLFGAVGAPFRMDASRSALAMPCSGRVSLSLYFELLMIKMQG